MAGYCQCGGELGPIELDVVTKVKKKMMMILSLSFHLILGSLFALWFFNTNGLRCNSAVLVRTAEFRSAE